MLTLLTTLAVAALVAWMICHFFGSVTEIRDNLRMTNWLLERIATKMDALQPSAGQETKGDVDISGNVPAPAMNGGKLVCK